MQLLGRTRKHRYAKACNFHSLFFLFLYFLLGLVYDCSNIGLGIRIEVMDVLMLGPGVLIPCLSRMPNSCVLSFVGNRREPTSSSLFYIKNCVQKIYI